MKKLTWLLLLLSMPLAAPGVASSGESAPATPAPIVRGGIHDKPFMFGTGQTRVGGYADLQYRFERVEGFTDDATFEVHQVNLFFFTPLHERIRFTSELEIEEGGEEITLELGILDFDISRVVSLRVGMLLSPIGRFNVAHDSPANDFVDRPLVARRVIPTTLSEPGVGLFGSFAPWEGSRLSYETYLVNGFDGDIVTSPDLGSPLEPGKGNLIDNNFHPSMVGRVALAPVDVWEIGVSAHSGPYTRDTVEGLTIGPRLHTTILAVDTELRWEPLEFRGEAARVYLDLPPELADLRGEDFAGLYGEVVYHFGRGWIGILPDSVFTAGLRYGYVDLDLDVSGDDTHRGTAGVNFRPLESVVFKANYQRDLIEDRDGNPLNRAALLFAAAAYF